MIKLEKVGKKFDRFVAVEDLSFEVSSGEVLGFLGPNGAGKTTTMKMITGFLAPSSGRIEVFGHDLAGDELAVKRLIGYLPEGSPAWDDMRVDQFLRFIAELRGFKGAEQTRRIDSVVESLELHSVLQRRIEQLSKGFKRRVGLAQAILHDPRVLILDEPTDGLDPNQKFKVRELIRGLASDKIIIISTHILEEVEALCSRVIMIANGRLVCDATPLELENRSEYHGAVTVQFSSVDDPLDKLAALPGVLRVEGSRENELRFTLIPKDDQPVTAALRSLSEQQQWSIEQLYVEKGRPDDVFRELTA